MVLFGYAEVNNEFTLVLFIRVGCSFCKVLQILFSLGCCILFDFSDFCLCYPEVPAYASGLNGLHGQLFRDMLQDMFVVSVCSLLGEPCAPVTVF